ncbi:MAG: hypothetical protein WC838_02595 [Candidatus Margulisiibacteriota bacterium]|jgi:hypothetical protein
MLRKIIKSTEQSVIDNRAEALHQELKKYLALGNGKAISLMLKRELLKKNCRSMFIDYQHPYLPKAFLQLSLKDQVQVLLLLSEQSKQTYAENTTHYDHMTVALIDILKKHDFNFNEIQVKDRTPEFAIVKAYIDKTLYRLAAHLRAQL